MKHKLLKTWVAASLGAFAVSQGAMAEGWYLGGGYDQMETDVVGIDFDLGSLGVRGGYQFNDFAAFEARAGIGISDDDFQGLVDLELDNYYGIYGKFGIPTQSGLYPYAVLGYTEIDLTVSGGGVSESDGDGDTSYGVGVAFDVSEQLNLFIEYMSWYDDEDVEISGFSLGATAKF